MKGITRSGGTWWCSGRFWSDRAQYSPTMVTAISTMKNAGVLAHAPARQIKRAVEENAAQLHLTVVEVDAEEKVWLRPMPEADWRVLEVAQKENVAQEVPRRFKNKGLVFRADDDRGQHACRMCARAVALTKAEPSRLGYEGLDRADVEVYAGKTWKKFWPL